MSVTIAYAMHVRGATVGTLTVPLALCGPDPYGSVAVTIDGAPRVALDGSHDDCPETLALDVHIDTPAGPEVVGVLRCCEVCR